MESIMHKVFGSRATTRQGLRQAVIAQLYATRSNPYAGSNNPQEKQVQVLNDLASSFSRFAGNQQTAFDNGASRSATVIDSSGMERQIARAFNQVLGRAPGRGVDSFMSALNGAFPLTATSEGQQVAFTPAKSVVSVYAPGNSSQNGYSNGSSAGSGLNGQLPARQAALYRQVSILVGDALGVLAGLQPFVPEANSEQVEALRSQIQTELVAQRDEVGRIDEPRPERVRAYFDSLILHITEFGRRSFLNRRDLIATSSDEAQIAGFELLKNYTSTLRDIWDRFYNDDRSVSAAPSLGERVERANILLPIIAQGVNDFEAAMDSVDFTESDRHSTATKFSGLIDPDVPLGAWTITQAGKSPAVIDFASPLMLQLTQPDMTVYDLTEWLDRFSTVEGPTSLADSGQYGLDFVTDQADTLFWMIVPIVTHIKVTAPSLLGRTTLDQVLSNERVGWALDNILTQLNALAELGAPSKKRNSRVL